MPQLPITPSPISSTAILLPADAGKDARSRLKRFSAWLDTTGRPWYSPDLAAYRDALRAAGLSPSSIRAHLATVRGRYTALLKDPAVLDRLEAAAYQACLAEGFEPNPANVQAAVGRLTGRIHNAIHPDAAPVTVPSLAPVPVYSSWAVNPVDTSPWSDLTLPNEVGILSA